MNNNLTKDIKRLFKIYPLTMSLIALSIFISIITGFGTFYPTMRWLVYSPNDVANGQIWRIITPIFLHFSVMGVFFAHLAFNMIALYLLGFSIERNEGAWILLTIVIISAIVSNLSEAYMSPNVLFGGMSGVDCALLGYLWVRRRLNPYYSMTVRPEIMNMFLISLVIFLVLGILKIDTNIANTAHVAGLITGAVLAFLQHKFYKKTYNKRII